MLKVIVEAKTRIIQILRGVSQSQKLIKNKCKGNHRRLPSIPPVSRGPPKATYLIGTQLRNQESPEEQKLRINRISTLVEQILIELGEDPSREGIKKTPERYAKALLFLTRGYEMKLSTIV